MSRVAPATAGGTDGRVPLRRASVVALTVLTAEPVPPRLIRWSEIRPSVEVGQLLVAVEVADGAASVEGIAARTLYHEGGERGDLSHREIENELRRWLGADVSRLPSRRPEHSTYARTRSLLTPLIELAALDALGRLTGLPAAAFLGGVCRSELPAYASLPSFADVDGALACACAARAAGFPAVKFHASGLPETDLATIAAARAELGPATTLMWDGNCAYDMHTAIRIGEALSRNDFLWFEAPVDDDATISLRSLARRVAVPLVPDGMLGRSPGAWARDVADGIWAALRFDATYSAGLADSLRLVRLAESLGIPCEIQSFGFPLTQLANLQLILATHHCRYFEVPFPLADFADAAVAPPLVEEGDVHAPAAPGLGHGLDVEALADARPLVRVTAEPSGR